MEEQKEQKPLLKRMDDMENILSDPSIAKRIKKLKLPKGAKVSKGKAKKGWVGVVHINVNGVGRGEKQKVEDSTFKTKDGIYHVTDGREIIKWDGKFPVLFQPENKLNPVNFFSEKNEVYGQKYLMARMIKDAIVLKKKGGGMGMILWVVIIGAVVYGGAKLLHFI